MFIVRHSMNTVLKVYTTTLFPPPTSQLVSHLSRCRFHLAQALLSIETVQVCTNTVLTDADTECYSRSMANIVLWKVIYYIPDPKMTALRDIAEEAGLTREQTRPDSVLMTKDSSVPVSALHV